MKTDKYRQILTDLNDDKQAEVWDSFVDRHPEATVFHASPWLKVLQRAYGFKPHHLRCVDETGNTVGVLPGFVTKVPFKASKFISLPFSDYGGALAADKEIKAQMARDLTGKVGEGFKSIEIRGDCENGDEAFKKLQIQVRHVLPLSEDKEEVYARLEKRTIRYSIRKAIKSDIEIRQENNPDGLQVFFLLNRMTRRKHGVPSQSIKFFNILYEELVSKGIASIYVAYHQSKPVSAGVFLTHGETVYYKYNASDPEALARKLTPNHLLTWRAIEDATASGMKYLDFGRTSIANTGLRRYKEMWGAEGTDLTYSFFPEIAGAGAVEEAGKAYAAFTRLWRKIPDWVEDRFGPLILKYFGSG